MWFWWCLNHRPKCEHYFCNSLENKVTLCIFQVGKPGAYPGGWVSVKSGFAGLSSLVSIVIVDWRCLFLSVTATSVPPEFLLCPWMSVTGPLCAAIQDAGGSREKSGVGPVPVRGQCTTIERVMLDWYYHLQWTFHRWLFWNAFARWHAQAQV